MINDYQHPPIIPNRKHHLSASAYKKDLLLKSSNQKKLHNKKKAKKITKRNIKYSLIWMVMNGTCSLPMIIALIPKLHDEDVSTNATQKNIYIRDVVHSYYLN